MNVKVKLVKIIVVTKKDNMVHFKEELMRVNKKVDIEIDEIEKIEEIKDDIMKDLNLVKVIIIDGIDFKIKVEIKIMYKNYFG